MNTMEVKILAKKLKKMINHLKSDGNTHQNTSAFLIANRTLGLPPCQKMVSLSGPKTVIAGN
jgi:hypothetical protein